MSNHDVATPKELAMEIKAKANLIVADVTYKINNKYELTTLYALVNYMDKFILRCLDRNGLICNKLWISARLIEVILILSTSKIKGILEIAGMCVELEALINGEKDGKQTRKSSRSNRPTRGRKKS